MRQLSRRLAVSKEGYGGSSVLKNSLIVEAATEQPTVQEGDKKKKVKKEKKVEEVKPTETVTTTEVVAEVITSVSPIDAAAAAKEALLKRAAQQSSQPNKSKASIEVSKAKQEILNRQQKVKRALGKKKEDL